MNENECGLTLVSVESKLLQLICKTKTRVPIPNTYIQFGEVFCTAIDDLSYW